MSFYILDNLYCNNNRYAVAVGSRTVLVLLYVIIHFVCRRRINRLTSCRRKNCHDGSRRDEVKEEDERKGLPSYIYVYNL